MITARALLRVVVGVLSIVAIGGSAWILSLPNRAECRASGRIVEPTERYCLSGTESQLLEEHAIFHTIPVVVIVVVLLALGYVMRRIIRHHRAHGAPNEPSAL
jgi:hypothetical protein